MNTGEIDPSMEQLTWRQGVRELFDIRFDQIDKQLAQLNTLAESLAAGVEHRAQDSNDTLRDLFDCNLTALGSTINSRYDALHTVTAKIEQQLISTADAGHVANEAVEQHSIMRYTGVMNSLKALEEQMIERVASLKQLIDLRSQLNETAISKSELATDRRFDAVNEFRTALADQTTHYVTSSILDAKLTSFDQQQKANVERFDNWTKTAYAWRTETTSRITSLEAKFYLGGAGIFLLMTTLQLVLNYVRH